METIFILLFILIVFVLFSKSVRLGEFLYTVNNHIEMKVAGLRYEVHHESEQRFVYLTNKQANKPNMLLLHGFSSDKYIWLKFAKYASKDYNLIIPDLMGHGDVAYSEAQNYSAYEQAKFMQTFIKALKLAGPLTIVGNSMGGMIGAILLKQSMITNAESNAESSNKRDFGKIGNSDLAKLVLVNTAGAKSAYAEQMYASKHNPFVMNDVESVYSLYQALLYQRPYLPPSVYAFIAQHQFLTKRAQYEKMFPEFFKPSEFLAQPISQGATKVILIWGEEDKLLPITDVPLWQNIVQCRTHILPKTGHVPMFERAKETYELVKAD